MSDETMNLGEVRDQLMSPKLFGVVETNPMGNDRRIVVQIEKGEHPDWGMQYEYREIRAVGTLFFDGEFTAIISAGEVV